MMKPTNRWIFKPFERYPPTMVDDRMCMLLTGKAIRDVLLFPTMKSLDGGNKKNDVNNTASKHLKKCKN